MVVVLHLDKVSLTSCKIEIFLGFKTPVMQFLFVHIEAIITLQPTMSHNIVKKIKHHIIIYFVNALSWLKLPLNSDFRLYFAGISWRESIRWKSLQKYLSFLHLWGLAVMTETPIKKCYADKNQFRYERGFEKSSPFKKLSSFLSCRH